MAEKKICKMNEYVRNKFLFIYLLVDLFNDLFKLN